MLIKLFKSSFYLQYLVLALLALVLWIAAVFNSCPIADPGPQSPLSVLLFGLLPQEPRFLAALGLLLLLFQALYLNQVLVRYELTPKNSLVAAFIYMLVMSQPLQGLMLTPMLCASTFLIMAFDRMLRTYGETDPTHKVFSAAMYLGLASLFYFPTVFIILALFLSMVVFSILSARIFLVSLAGLFTVYLYLMLYYFLDDHLEGILQTYLDWFGSLPELSSGYPAIQLILPGLQLFLMLIAFFSVLTGMGEWNISIRKRMLFVFYLFIVSLPAFYYLLDDLPQATLLLALPVSVFISVYLASARRIPRWQEFFVLLWFLATAVIHLIPGQC